MPRKKFYPHTEMPFHVTARTSNKEWFGVPMEIVWSHFANYLHFIWRVYDVRIHAFVLMSNHFHMLITTPEANLDIAMNYLLREVSKRLGEEYLYSSLPGLLGLDYLYIPVYDNLGLIQNPGPQLKWLNDRYNDNHREAIQKALKRKEFGFSRDESTARPHFLESHIV